ncbi:MAG: ABC transporter substrate-binding protein [Rhizobiaceae bacterium]|nr:ABC transporter substrate-binding protein [Rhizobiaceae bacterium]
MVYNNTEVRANLRGRRSILKNCLGAFAAAAISIGVAGLSSVSEAQASDTTYKFAGSPTWLGQVPIMVAIEKGYFKDEGVNVEFTTILSSSDRIAALAAGSVHFSNLGRVAVIAEMARGNDAFYFVGNVDDSPGNEGCWARPGVGSIADLKGKKVAANSSAEITLTLLLQKNGMTQKDIEFINLPPTEMAPAISRGDVEAACVWQPLLEGLKAAVPDGKLLGTDKDTAFYDEFKTMAAPDIVIMRRDLVNNEPEVASKIMAALFKGAEFATSDPDETAKIVSKYFKKEPGEIVESIRAFDYFGAKDWQAHFDVHKKQMQALTNLLSDLGKISERPDVSGWAKADFIKQ